MKRVKLAALVVGAGFVAWLVVRAGPGKLYEGIALAGPLFAAIVACELAIALGDLFAIRLLLGQRLPLGVWVGSTAAAYASSLLLPAGRAAGEALRTAALAPYVGAGRAARACSRMQACALAANATVSLVGSWFVADGALRIALVGNALVCGAIATVILLVVRSARFAAFVEKRLPKLVASHRGAADEAPRPGATFRATLPFVAARFVQVFQYGLLVHAIARGKGSQGAGAHSLVELAFTAHAIHLVGASVGDFVPGQLGVAEGSFHAFAAAIGVDDVRALSLALVARASQLLAAAVCAPLLVMYSKKRLGPHSELPADAPVPSRRENARPPAE